MARQSTTAVMFPRSTQRDTAVTMSSGRAGKVVPVTYLPVLPGDTVGGRVGIDIQLKEMPKPLLNRVSANFQAWFVPKSALPQFSGRDELMHARTGEVIKALGSADRTPPPYFTTISGANLATVVAGEIFTTLGIHVAAGAAISNDLLDAYGLIQNFRIAANSSKIARRKYASEDIVQASVWRARSGRPRACRGSSPTMSGRWLSARSIWMSSPGGCRCLVSVWRPPRRLAAARPFGKPPVPARSPRQARSMTT